MIYLVSDVLRTNEWCKVLSMLLQYICIVFSTLHFLFLPLISASRTWHKYLIHYLCTFKSFEMMERSSFKINSFLSIRLLSRFDAHKRIHLLFIYAFNEMEMPASLKPTIFHTQKNQVLLVYAFQKNVSMVVRWSAAFFSETKYCHVFSAEIYLKPLHSEHLSTLFSSRKSAFDFVLYSHRIHNSLFLFIVIDEIDSQLLQWIELGLWLWQIIKFRISSTDVLSMRIKSIWMT